MMGSTRREIDSSRRSWNNVERVQDYFNEYNNINLIMSSRG